MTARPRTPGDSIGFVLAALCCASVSGCVMGANQDPSVAAGRAFQFLEAVVVRGDSDSARDLVTPASRLTDAEWSRSVAEMRRPSPPSQVRAVGYLYATTENAIDIYFSGGADAMPQWRVRVAGDLDTGYRVAAFERLQKAPSSPLLPLQPTLATDPATPRDAPADARVSFAAIDADPDMVSELARHYARELGLETDVLEPIVPNAASVDATRDQLIANELGLRIRERFGEELARPKTVIIGVTGRDMYIRGISWGFALSYRMPPQIAVVSYFRMDPQVLGKAPDTAVTRSRLRKMIAKNIGLLVYGLPASTDATSLLFRDILGVHELDLMVEDYQRAGMRAR